MHETTYVGAGNASYIDYQEYASYFTKRRVYLYRSDLSIDILQQATLHTA